MVHFFTVNILVHTLHGFRWQMLLLLLLELHATLALARMAPHTAATLSPVLALAAGVYGLRVVLIKMGPEGRVAARFAHIYAAVG